MNDEEGSDLLARLSELSLPYGVALDSEGNIAPTAGTASP
jgi:hypothetical protein